MWITEHLRRGVLLLVLLALVMTGVSLIVAPPARADQSNVAAVTQSPTSISPTTPVISPTAVTPDPVAAPPVPVEEPSGGVSPAPADASPQSTDPPTSTDGGAQPKDPAPVGGSQQLATSTTPAATTPAATTPTAPSPSAGTTQSNTTTQTIWQVQQLGCSAHCKGASQSQSAEQQNTTVETEMPSAGAPTRTSNGGITQIQIGCLSHCFGKTTVTGGSHQPPHRPTPPVLPAQSPVAGNEQNEVDQSSIQSQDSSDPDGAQTQTAQQSNTTVQSGGPGSAADLLSLVDSASKPGAPDATVSSGSRSPVLSVLSSLGYLFSTPATSGGVSPADGSSVSSDPNSSTTPSDPTTTPSDPTTASSSFSQVVNQVEQGIWQIQIGCLIFCVGTTQSQQAAQSDTTILVSPAGTASSDAGGSTTLETDQVIWQLQIGCLFWCYDAVQTQTAAANGEVLSAQLPVAAPPPTPAGGNSSPPPTQGGAVSSPGPGTPPAPANSPVGLTAPTQVSSGPAPTVPVSDLKSAALVLPQPAVGTWVLTSRATPSRSSIPADATAAPALSLDRMGSSRLASGDGVGRASKARLVGADAVVHVAGAAGTNHRLKTVYQRPTAVEDDTTMVLVGVIALVVALLGASALWRSRRPSGTHKVR